MCGSIWSGNRGRSISSERLSEQAAYNEFVMTSLRTAAGLDAGVLERRFGARKLQYFTRMAVKSLAEGTLVCTGSVYRIPFEHYLISDTVISDLFMWNDTDSGNKTYLC